MQADCVRLVSDPLVGLSNSERTLQVSSRKIVDTSDVYWMFGIWLMDFWWNWMGAQLLPTQLSICSWQSSMGLHLQSCCHGCPLKINYTKCNGLDLDGSCKPWETPGRPKWQGKSMSVGPKPDFPRERETQREKENCFVSITCIHQSIVFNTPNSGRHFFCTSHDGHKP